MPVESAADLASMFSEDEFAEAADYLAPVAGAVAVPCTPIVDRGQGRRPQQLGESQVSGSERRLWVRKAELATVERGGLFRMLDAAGVQTGELFRVAGPPVLDHLAALWSVDLTIED